MIKQLQKKFIIYASCISAVVLILIGIFINVLNYNSVITTADQVIDTLNDNEFIITEFFMPQQEAPREIQNTTRFFLAYTDESNEITDINTQNISFEASSFAINYIEEVINSEEETGVIDGYRFVKLDSDTGYIYAFLDIEDNMVSVYNLLKFSSIVIIIAIIFIFGLACVTSRKVVKPIAEGYERQKKFITNVSHEFKTPLAIIKADTDVIEIESSDNEWTSSIKNQVKRLDSLVVSLIELTKLEEKKSEIIKTDFSLSDSLDEKANEFSSLSQEKFITIVNNTKENISYCGEEASIRKLFEILLENSIKYATDNTEIILDLKKNGNEIIFTIENQVENINVGKHNDWFERFYREDKVRNGEAKGFGLGLSIAKNICDNSNIKIMAESKDERSVVITLNF